MSLPHYRAISSLPFWHVQAEFLSRWPIMAIMYKLQGTELVILISVTQAPLVQAVFYGMLLF